MESEFCCTRCSREQSDSLKMVALTSGDMICKACVEALKSESVSPSALKKLRQSRNEDVLCFCCSNPLADLPAWGSTKQIIGEKPYVVCDSCLQDLENIVSDNLTPLPQDDESLMLPTINDPFLPYSCQPGPTFSEFTYAHLLKGLVSQVVFDELMKTHLGPDYAANASIHYIDGQCRFQSPKGTIQIPAFILGSYNRQNESFLWAFHNSNVANDISDELFEPTFQVCDFAAEHGYSELFPYQKKAKSRLLYIRGDYIGALSSVITGYPTFLESCLPDGVLLYVLLGSLGDELVKPNWPFHPNNAFWVPIYQLSLLQKNKKWPELDIRKLLQNFANETGLSIKNKGSRTIVSDLLDSKIEIALSKDGRSILGWEEELTDLDQYSGAVVSHLFGCSYD